jgi:hypothetical protein
VRVSKNDTICGLAVPAARQLMRAYFDDRPVEVACDILGVSQDAARDQMRTFEAAGYAERGGLAHGAGDNWWATTVKGNALAHASFGKPISRATATRLLGQVIERARAYNADPGRLLTVTEIVVLTYSTPEPSGFSIIASSDVRLGGEAGGLPCCDRRRPPRRSCRRHRRRGTRRHRRFAAMAGRAGRAGADARRADLITISDHWGIHVTGAAQISALPPGSA